MEPGRPILNVMYQTALHELHNFVTAWVASPQLCFTFHVFIIMNYLWLLYWTAELFIRLYYLSAVIYFISISQVILITERSW